MRSAIVRTDRYSHGAILFHWVIAVAVVINLYIGIGGEFLPRGWTSMPLHKSIGITVLVLSLARLVWRLTHRPPPMVGTASAWERIAAGAAHWGLYALTIIMPLTGWMMSSGGNPPRPLNWFGLFPVPLLPVDKATSGFGHDAHGVLGYGMAALVVLHVLAALRHHLLLRDSTLVRMLPIVRAPTGH